MESLSGMCKVPCLMSSTAKKHRSHFFGSRVTTHSLRSSSSLGQTINQARKGDTPPSSSGNTHQWHTGIWGCWCPERMQSSLQESHILKTQKLRDIQHHQHSLSILCSTKYKSYCFILKPDRFITLSPHFRPGHPACSHSYFCMFV